MLNLVSEICFQFQKQLPEVFRYISQNSQENTCLRVFFNKVFFNFIK